MKDLIDLVNQLEERKIGFKSLHDPADTTSPASMLVFHIFGALAEFERNLIRESTKAGLAAARARGKKARRRRALNGEQAHRLYQPNDDVTMDGREKNSIEEVCEMMGNSRSTRYSYLGARNEPGKLISKHLK